MSEVRAMEALDDVQHFRVRVHVDPTPIVETYGINDERISLPLSGGVAHPGRIAILGMRAAVQEHLPHTRGELENLHQERRSLHELIEQRTTRNRAPRQTCSRGVANPGVLASF